MSQNKEGEVRKALGASHEKPPVQGVQVTKGNEDVFAFSSKVFQPVTQSKVCNASGGKNPQSEGSKQANGPKGKAPPGVPKKQAQRKGVQTLAQPSKSSNIVLEKVGLRLDKLDKGKQVAHDPKVGVFNVGELVGTIRDISPPIFQGCSPTPQQGLVPPTPGASTSTSGAKKVTEIIPMEESVEAETFINHKEEHMDMEVLPSEVAHTDREILTPTPNLDMSK